MLCLLAAAIFHTSAEPIRRDDFGVPHITAPDLRQAFQSAGAACAEDRLWQLETSRRIARGSMSAVFGERYLSSDREALLTGYTDAELKRQFDTMSPETRAAFNAYAAGINQVIERRTREGSLPKGYRDNGFHPEPWTILDSSAIAIRLFRLFGQGGAGELRNWAMFQYMQGRVKGDQAIDVFDDFLWENDPDSPTTIAKVDDPLAGSPPRFEKLDRATTKKHLARLPKTPIFELLPAIRVASNEQQRITAEMHSAPSKTGSYAIVVAPSRSKTGAPILLSAPQMGHTTPSVVYEMSIDCPEYAAVGMTVPGVPGIAIGHSKYGAWGMTSGVMDTTDIFFSVIDGKGGYLYDGKSMKFETVEFELAIKGKDATKFVQKRTRFGPVVLESKTGEAVFSQKSTFWMKELQSMDAMFAAPNCATTPEIERAIRKATVSFNFFYALQNGSIGYRYLGISPSRAPGIDPRFPTPGEPSTDWRGVVPYEKMPRMTNPKSSLMTNWNNKPVAWWPNSDTPAWGRVFRVEALNRSIPEGKLTSTDLEQAAWKIARLDPNYWQTMAIVRPSLQKLLADLENPKPNVRINGRYVDALRRLLAFDGRTIEGSDSAYLFNSFFRKLREEIFLPTTGNFLSDSTFQIAAQASVVLQALEGKTRFDYRKGRSVDAIVASAFNKAYEAAPEPNQWWYLSGKINYAGETPVPYIDRGTFIQIVEVPSVGVRGRSVAAPGAAEEGRHATDQIPLARAWTFKRMEW